MMIDDAIRENIRVYEGRVAEELTPVSGGKSYFDPIPAIAIDNVAATEQAAKLAESSAETFSLDIFPALTHSEKSSDFSQEINPVDYPEITQDPPVNENKGNAAETLFELIDRESRMSPQNMRQG